MVGFNVCKFGYPRCFPLYTHFIPTLYQKFDDYLHLISMSRTIHRVSNFKKDSSSYELPYPAITSYIILLLAIS